MKNIVLTLFFVLHFPLILLAAPSCMEYLISGSESSDSSIISQSDLTENDEVSEEPRELKFKIGMNQESINNYLSIAKESLQRRSFHGVLDYVNPILVHDNKNVSALFLYAKAQMGLGNVAKAFKAQTKLMKLDGTYHEGHYVFYSQLLIYSGYFKEAEKFLVYVLKKNPTSKSALGLLTKVFLNTGRLNEARDLLMGKLDSEPDNIMNQILLYEYYYKSFFFHEAYKIANSFVEQNRPKKGQERVPRIYRKGLVLRSKVVAKMNRDLEQAWRDVDMYDRYNSNSANWVAILKAEIQFKMGRADRSRSILLELASTMKEVDLLVIAGLIHLETQGQPVSLSQSITDPLLNHVVSNLSQKQLFEVMRLLKNFSWEYLDDGTGEQKSNISNSFWLGDSFMQPRNSDTNNATRKLPPEFY